MRMRLNGLAVISIMVKADKEVTVGIWKGNELKYEREKHW